jgi:DNA-binding NarL/FixJ family response regulator
MISALIVDDHALFRVGVRSRLQLEHDITLVSIPSGSLAGEVLLEESIWLTGPSMILYAG